MRKPKIAVIHPGIGNSQGGSQVFVLELTKRLECKCDITILSGKKVNNLCKPVFSLSRGKMSEQNSLAFNVFRSVLKSFMNTPDIVIEHMSSYLPIVSHLLVNDYDVIYPNNDWGGLLAAATVRKIKGTPILFTEHNGFLDKGKIAHRNLKFKPDKYVTLSRDFQNWVGQKYPEQSTVYIPNGVNMNMFKPFDSVANDRPFILAAARNHKSKRLDLVIEAVAMLGNPKLAILTSGENLDNLKQKGLSKLGKDRFELLTVPYSEMPAYYNKCDIFTLPSEYEPFGLVYLEAMACNKPVVAAEDPSRRDIVGDAGILCNVDNVEEYANALNAALHHDFEDKPLSRAKMFSWEACADRYYEEIQALCK